MEESRKTEMNQVPIWKKYTLTVQEAAEYFRIGDKKLRKLIDEHPDADFMEWNTTTDKEKVV